MQWKGLRITRHLQYSKSFAAGFASTLKIRAFTQIENRHHCTVLRSQCNISISRRKGEIIHCEQTRLDNFYVFLWQAVRKMWAKIGIFDQPGKATPFPPIGTPKTVLKINCLFSRLFQPRLFYQSIPNCRLFLRAPILSDQVLHLQRISLHIGFNSAIYVP